MKKTAKQLAEEHIKKYPKIDHEQMKRDAEEWLPVQTAPGGQAEPLVIPKICVFCWYENDDKSKDGEHREEPELSEFIEKLGIIPRKEETIHHYMRGDYRVNEVSYICHETGKRINIYVDWF